MKEAMEILIHDIFFEKEGLGQRLQDELRPNFRTARADLETLARSHRSLKCVLVESLTSLEHYPDNLLSSTVMISLGPHDPLVASKFLDLGVADYILGPVEPSYLAAKIRSVARRVRESNIGIVTDEIQQRSGQNLTEKERRLLNLLLRVGETGATRLDLTQACWPNTTVHHKTLDTHLFNLRRKLEAAGYEVLFTQSRWKLLRPSHVPSGAGSSSGHPNPEAPKRRIG